MQTIQQVLMSRDGISREEADKLVRDAQADLMGRLAQGESPDDICEEWFGLEPDYIMQLI